MSLTDDIQKVQTFVQGNTPHNEASTCQWVILPLLYGAGYGLNEVSPQVSNAAQKIPDYTILPNSSYTWYLEAKDWNKPLRSDSDLFQAISYANHSGHRWVVLSNGSEWHLYDDFIKGVSAPQKLVASAHLDKAGEIEEFLAAVGKISVCSGLLESYASKSRLTHIIKTELYKPGGKLLEALNTCLCKDFGIGGTQPEDILKVLGQATVSASVSKTLPVTLPQAKSVTTPLSIKPQLPPNSPAVPIPIVDPEPVDIEYNFEQYTQQRHTLTDKKPVGVRFADSVEWQPITVWADFVPAVVEWIARQDKLPALPYKSGKGKLYFLNTMPFHSDAKGMRHPKDVTIGSKRIYIDTSTSTSEKIKQLHALCKAANVSTTDIFVKLA